MPDLSFQIEQVEVAPFSAAPQLTFKLRLSNANAGETIHTVALRCQIQLEVARRRYSPQDQEGLLDLFGSPDRWGQTLQDLPLDACQRRCPVVCRVPLSRILRSRAHSISMSPPRNIFTDCPTVMCRSISCSAEQFFTRDQTGSCKSLRSHGKKKRGSNCR